MFTISLHAKFVCAATDVMYRERTMYDVLANPPINMRTILKALTADKNGIRWQGCIKMYSHSFGNERQRMCIKTEATRTEQNHFPSPSAFELQF